MYQPIDDFLVDYAYDHGIEQLSDAITLYGLETRYKSMREGVTEYSKKTEEELISKYKSLKSKVKFNLNQIYESNEKRGCSSDSEHSLIDTRETV